MRPVRILFVCLGNICRSPSAEGVFRHLITAQTLQHRFEVDSAGTGAWHIGSPPDERARRSAHNRGIDLSDLRGRQLQHADGENFDYLIAMDQQNRRDIQKAIDPQHHKKIHLFLSFLPEFGISEVPDPYFGDGDGFEAVLDMIEQASESLIQHALSSGS